MPQGSLEADAVAPELSWYKRGWVEGNYKPDYIMAIFSGRKRQMSFSKSVDKYLSITVAVGALIGMAPVYAQLHIIDFNKYCKPGCSVGGRCVCYEALVPSYLVPEMADRFVMRRGTVDNDKDGVVSPEEAASDVERSFYESDVNSDNVISFEERRAFHASSNVQGCDLPCQKTLESRFKEEDKDHDGQLTKTEYMMVGKTLFEKSDINGDGKVDSFEFRAYR
jgi:EF hand